MTMKFKRFKPIAEFSKIHSKVHMDVWGKYSQISSAEWEVQGFKRWGSSKSKDVLGKQPFWTTASAAQAGAAG